jgi:thymidylate kinase
MGNGIQRGKLIVFEGPDGAGKTTLANALVNHLNGRGIKSIYASFPGREQGGLGELVYNFHHRELESGTVHPVSKQLLHVAAHIDLVAKLIDPMLASGCWVVLDRYWWSTWVYGKVSGAPESALSLMVQIELDHWYPTFPDVIFLLARKASLGELSLPFKDDVADEYEEVASRETGSRVVRIDTTGRSLLESLSEVVRNTVRGRADESKISSVHAERRDPDDSGDKGCGFSKRGKPQASPLMDAYWRFAAERQKVFFARLRGEAPPWTNDQILQKHKFTNAYRASDRVSQYLIRNVIYGGGFAPEDEVFRTLLFKLFNKIETWELLTRECGEINVRNFSVERYSEVLSAAQARGEKIYSAAYIMPSGQSEQRKHRFHLNLLQQMMSDHLPAKLMDCRRLESVFEVLRSYPSLGPFLAFQFTIDLNYGLVVDFSEMTFVVPGPGARDGIRKCFQSLGDYSETDLIRFVADEQHESFDRLGLHFQDLWGRPLHLIDCQNLFCEVDKYSRVAHPEYNGVTGRTRIKQIFRANSEPILYWYPPKWGINERVESEVARYASV